MPNRPPNVAIVGRPNVGKSALFNRLVGRKIAIVHDQPGITRDRISAICKRAARPFTVWDTGGIIGVGERELSAQVRRAAEEALRESDLLLFVVDAKEGLSPVDEELARVLRKSQKPVLLVINKIDNENTQISAANAALCAHHAEHLHRTRMFATPADSRRVNENELSRVALVKNVNGVASRPGQLAHDCALSAHNGIDK